MEDAKWYVVHTYSGYENKVADNIIKVVENRKMQNEILEVKVPTEDVVVSSKSSRKDEVPDASADSKKGEKTDKKPKTKTISRKLYPGYVFVKMRIVYHEAKDDGSGKAGEWKMTDEAWYVVRNTRGVTGFVGPESKPRALSEDEVYDMGIQKRVVELPYDVGDLVTVVYHSMLKGQQGTVKSIDVEKEKVTIITSMMGHATIELDLDQVEPVKD